MKENGFYRIFIRFQILFLYFAFFLKYTKSNDLKVLYLSQNKYYFITYEKIYFYKVTPELISSPYTFNDNQKIQAFEELNMVNFGIFKDTNLSIIIIKNYIYAISETIHYCNNKKEEITGYYPEVFPLNCTSYCHYIIGFLNTQNLLNLFLYETYPNDYCNSNLVYSLVIDNISSENYSCQLILSSSSNGDLLICFLGNSNPNKLIVYKLKVTNEKIENLEYITKWNIGAKIIKSVLSKDGTKSYICYINNDDICECLTYSISDNEWSTYTSYINSCLSKTFSLFFYYHDISDDYSLYCYKSTSEINLIKLDENLGILSTNNIDTYNYAKKCSQYILSSLEYGIKNISIINACYYENLQNQLLVGNFLDLPTTIVTNIITTFPKTTILSTLPDTTIPITNISTSLSITTIPNLESRIISTIPSISRTIHSLYSTIISINQPTLSTTYFDYNNGNENQKIIIQEKSQKSKEEIISNIENAMKDYEINKIYEIFGDDYNIKISPINTNFFQNISTNIHFSNCENLLREKYKLASSSVLTVYQIEIENHNEHILINKLEYAIFNDKKEKLDLLVCKDEEIEIRYQLNTSKINKTKIKYYSELGIDIFNSEDKFFNDICYPYSENDSDMILKDRVKDIYQNFSLCENNCKYDKMNLTDNTVNCKCSIKIEANSTFEKPKLAQIIRDSFTDSNLGVMKCLNLVFSLENKVNNIGFWIFSILVFAHLPLFIYFFIFNISSIKSYIFSKMKQFNYFSYFISNPNKKVVANRQVRLKSILKKASGNNIQNKNNNSKTKKGNSTNSLIFLRTNKMMLDNNIPINHEKTNTKIITQFDKSKKSNKSSSHLLNINKIEKVKTLHNISLFGKKKGKKSIIKMIDQNDSNSRTSKNISNKKIKKLSLSLIQAGVNNSKKIKPKNSNTILDSFKYETAINYDKRNLNEKEELKYSKSYSLIQMDAKNISGKKPKCSNLILDIYDFKTAIKYEKRTFWKLLYICIITKENIFNIIYLKHL